MRLVNLSVGKTADGHIMQSCHQARCIYSIIARCIADLTDVEPYAAVDLCKLAASKADVSAIACQSLLLLLALGLLLPCMCSCLLLV